MLFEVSENVIRDTKACGLSNLPFDDIVSNDVWMQLCFRANDLFAWAQRIGCVGQLPHATPKTIRHRLFPDSNDHWVCITSSVPAGRKTMARSAMINLDNSVDTNGAGTDLYRVETSACGNSTDVWFQEADLSYLGSGFRGWAPCVVYGAYGVICDRAIVYVDPVAIFNQHGGFGGNPTQLDINLYKTYHHEAGHTAGLGHSSGVQMMESGPVPADLGYLGMTAHDACHINNYLPGGNNCTP